MKTVKAFRFRVYPTAAQQARLERWRDALRFLWNLAHEQRLWGLDRPRCERKYYSAFQQGKDLTELRAVLPWLADIPRGVCEQLLCDIDIAWQRCFKNLGHRPRWKRKGIDSISPREAHRRSWKISDRAVCFPKLGSMRVVQHRPLEGKPKTCTLACEAGQWFAAISCEIEMPTPAPRTAPVVALDRGCVNLIADSDGKTIENPRHLRRSQSRLARAQRTVSRRKKGSKNREKAKLRVAKLHRKVRRQRDHVLHEISTTYAKSHGTVVVEKLYVANMSSGGGARKTGLNRSIMSAGWGRLVEMLRYKLAWSGGQLVEVPAAYSSQTCSSCGAVDPKSRVSQSEFVCVGCGVCDHADLNAAKVLKQRFEAPGNPWCLPVDGSASKGPGGSRKRKVGLKRPTFRDHLCIAQG